MLSPPLKKAYGIHPWFSSLSTEDDFLKLSELLPSADLLGEIGLDKIAKDQNGLVYDMDRQIDVFNRQIELGILHNKPASIHCVKAYGHFFECVKELKNCPNLMMHSFSGNRQILERLLKLEMGIYFSFSYFVNGRYKEEKWKEVIAAAPDDRILIESDLHSYEDVEESLLNIFRMVCVAKNWNENYAVKILETNTKEFLK